MKKKYGLFARDSYSKNVKMISLSDYDIYGEGNKYNKEFSTLEDIDLFTAKFNDKSELITYLVNVKGLDFSAADLFIGVCDGTGVQHYELLYSGDFAQNVIDKTHQNNSSNGKKYVLQAFSYRMYHDEDFYNFIMNGCTKIDERYINYYRGGFRQYDVTIPMKYRDDGWASKSYDLCRNVACAMQEYDMYKDYKPVDVRAYQKGLTECREDVKDIIELYFSDDYTDHDQLGLQLELYLNDDQCDKISAINDLYQYLKLEHLVFKDGEVNFDCTEYGFSSDDNDRINELDQCLKKILYIDMTYTAFIFSGDETFSSEYEDVSVKLINMLKTNPDLLDRFYSFIVFFCDKMSKYNKKRGDDKGSYVKV